jgi:hypothetical protein
MKNSKLKTKIIALLAVNFVVFATTLFALAQSQNNNSLFLDSDQDGLTDQEEKMIGTDPFKAVTDGDGYSDGKEVGSGYNPLKPAPGDKLVPTASSTSSASDFQQNASAQDSASDSTSSDQSSENGQTDPANAALVKAFAAAKRDANGPFQMPAYSGVKIIADAITGAKSTDPEKVAAYIHANSFKTPIGNVEYDKKGDLKSFKFVVFTWHKDATKTEAK